MKVVKILCGFALLAGVAFGLLQWWAARRLASYDRGWTEDINLLRQHNAAVRMPVLHGEGTDENAAELHRALFTSLGPFDAEQYKHVLRAVQTGPCAPLPPETLALLQERRGEVARLRRALRGRRVDWGFPYEDGFDMKLLSLAPARTLAGLLVLEGHEHAQAGDGNAAADSYLLAARFGADLGAEPQLVMGIMGVAISRMGVDALGTLVTTCPSNVLAWTPLAAEMDRLQPVLPSAAAGFWGERVHFESLPRAMARRATEGLASGSGSRLGATLGLLWSQPFLAHAVSTLDPLLAEMARTAALDDPREYRRAANAAIARSEHSWNPLVRISMPSLIRAGALCDELRARFRLARAALALEQRRAVDRRFPSELAPRPGMEDPFAWPAALRYRPDGDGTGYTLWSVGLDEKDDGGIPEKDLVLRHPPTR